MGRGNLTELKSRRNLLGFYIIEVFGDLDDYDKIYVSKSGQLIGQWGKKCSILLSQYSEKLCNVSYRDYIYPFKEPVEIVKVTDTYVILKPIKKTE